MITKRQLHILKIIVEEYAKTMEPISSKILASSPEFMLNYSSATIRNDMSILEEFGYILKTHTSSGRIPSEEGYRMYVKEMLKDKESISFYDDSFPLVDEIIEKNFLSREEAVKESMVLVADLTNYASIVMGPAGYNAKIRKIEFVAITGRQAVILMVTDKGNVESKKIIIPETISVDEISKVITFLNEVLYDCPINQIYERIKEKFKDQTLTDFINFYDELIAAFIRTFTIMAKDDFYMSGQNKMFNQPEFKNAEKFQELMLAIEKEDLIKSITKNAPRDQISVRIGKENTISAMRDCTIITVPYETSNGELGTIAIVGPTRMEYQKIIPLLEYIAANIKKIN